MKREAVAPGSPLAKRAIDLVGAVVGSVVLMPVIAATAVAIRINMGSPVLFKQVRPGLRGRLFTIYKFRTMRVTSDEQSDEARLTALGTFLRATSLDELPQLWNVLRGEMSLVGPRPLLPEYLPLYSREHARRHELKPGVTSWNAVNGRNSLEWKDQLDMDVWYVDHQTSLLDLKIMVLTVWAVLAREGVTQDGRATRDRFTGLGEAEGA